MGRYEARPSGSRLGLLLRRKAKAIMAGVTALVLGEVVLILGDTETLAAIHDAVPPVLQPFIPVLAAAIIYAVTHQVRNAPTPPSEQ